MNASASQVEMQKLGLGTLTAIVFGMMVGSGLYNIPQNLAAGAGPVAVAVAWAVTAAGMLLLVATLKILADRRPDLDAGIYQYAQRGFGDYAGFNIAWGYWLCTAFANVAYAVMLNDSFGAFWPVMLGHGWPTLAFGSALIWMMYFIVSRGIRTARVINNLMAVVKIVAICLVAVLLVLNFRYGTLSLNMLNEPRGVDAITSQVKSTMLVTLWCFIGIEGAVMMSARAKRSKDVGRAGVAGFLIAWLLYVLVSMLCYGVMSRAQLADLPDPSVAYVLRHICGAWAYWFVIASVIVSLLGGWLAWTLVCAQVPFEAAAVRIFPRSFLRLNRHGMPAFGLVVSSVVMELFLMLVLMAADVYMAALSITGMMVLPAYLLAGIYLLQQSCISGGSCVALPHRRVYGLVGAMCSAYCLWLIYAGGLQLFALTSVFYVAGAGFYLRSLAERTVHRSGYLGRCRAMAGAFTASDRLTLAVLAVGLAASIWLAATGRAAL